MNRFNDFKAELMDSPDNWKANDDLKKIGGIKLKNDFYESQPELIFNKAAYK